jgi:plasmid stabilization system protein ParE
MNLEFHRLVALEFSEAAEFYDLKKPGLAKEFENELNKVLARIVANPFLFAEVRGVRRALLARFPFSVLYRQPDSGTVRVLALRHHKRKPLLGTARK